MLVECPISTCNVMIEKNEHSVRNHFRWEHPKLKNKAYWRDKACKFVDSSGFKTRSRTIEENHLSKLCGIK